MTKLDFEVTTQYGVYRDALYLDREYTQQEIDAMKHARVSAWLALIEASSQVEAE